MQNEKTYTAEADVRTDEKAGVIRSAEILTIGTEILLGDLVDTNSAWLSSHLASLGISLYRHTTVGDNRQRITGAVRPRYHHRRPRAYLRRPDQRVPGRGGGP